MTYQITLTPEEYAALSRVATKQGKTVEALVHEAVAERIQTSMSAHSAAPLGEHEFLERLYRSGVISNMPTRRPDTSAEAAERERLINSIAPGTPLSEMVIEVRGPRE